MQGYVLGTTDGEHLFQSSGEIVIKADLDPAFVFPRPALGRDIHELPRAWLSSIGWTPTLGSNPFS